MTNADLPEWQVALQVRTAILTASEVDALVGVRADRVSSNPGRRWPVVWELDSGRPATADLDDHLAALVERCSPMADQIATLAGRPQTDVNLTGVVRFKIPTSGGPAPAMWLPPSVLVFAARCALGIDIDSYPTIVT
jgi:Domain of unknown function (DUF4279)